MISKETLMSNHPERPPAGPEDWDSLIDNPFNIGPFDRKIKAGDWWVITGMHVKLPDALVGRPDGTSKLLVLADTISVGVSGATEIKLNDWSDVLLIGASVNQYNGCTFHRDHYTGDTQFCIAVYGRTSEHFSPSDSSWRITFPQVLLRSNWSSISTIDLGNGRQPVQTQIHMSGTRGFQGVIFADVQQLPLPNSGPVFDACREFLARLLLTAQFLFEKNRTADANRLLARLETLLALRPVASWQEIVPQIAATREMFQPQLPGSDRVPNLSPAVYDGVAKSYGPALQKFADTFQQFVNRTGDISERTRVMKLMLNKEDNAIKFQALVTEQLEGNLKAATENLSRAEKSLNLQIERVDEAKREFDRGLAKWRKEKETEVALAITTAVLSTVADIAGLYLGKPPDLAGIGATVRTLIEWQIKIKKLLKTLAKLMELATKIYPQAIKSIKAGELAKRMAALRREAEAGLGDAPSESAYWDQFWVEIKIALATAVDEDIPGAAEYLEKTKVFIIYGRALTSAQVAIVPIAQELAQAELLTKLAEGQRGAVQKEIDTLQARQRASAPVAVALWLRHRSVQRAMFAALQDYDAAHRYWALTDERPHRDLIEATAENLLKVADLQVGFKQALESFNPPPQDFKEDFPVPAEAVADFLRDGSFALRFTPDFGPFAELEDVGRVRVEEVAVWVTWNTGKRPKTGKMEFTIETNGDYYDQRVVSGKPKPFRFIGPRVNRTFRYDIEQQSIDTPGKVAAAFRAFFFEPTLFTEWQFSLPKKGGGALKREAFQDAVSSIRLEFRGSFIKDLDRFF
jgi:hypothetical protein